jgi:hypothetical protein
MVRKNQVRAVAEVQAAVDVDAGFGERFDFGNEGRGIDYDTGADDGVLFRAQDSAGNELQHEAIFADDDGVTGIVPAGDASDVIESAGEIVDDFAFAFVTPLRADYDD